MSDVPLALGDMEPARSSPDSPLWVGRVIPSTEAEGPGVRTAVWVQGCTIRCPGCFNPQLWKMRGGEVLHPASALLLATEHGVEGLTFLGGEPFDQAFPVAAIASAARQKGFSVMVFTGYNFSQLLRLASAGREDIRALLESTDLLVDGPFIEALIDRERPWVGSTNQKFHYLTPRYASLDKCLNKTPDRVEVRIRPDGTVELNGWAPGAMLEALLDHLPVTPVRGAGRSRTETSRDA